MDDDFLVSIDDAYRAGYCSLGVVAFMKRTGLSLRLLMKGQMPASQLLATHDGYADKVVATARKRLGLLDG